jgi:phosphatidylserine/phosphatidylglycerophosphate/cardiolipin synthase-like enzyme
LTTDPLHTFLARLVAHESAEVLDDLESALEEGRIELSPTVAAIQDALRINNPRAQTVREMLFSRDGRSLPEILDILRMARAAADQARLDAPRVEVAWTHPGPLAPTVRTTGAVAREVIEAAQRSLLVVGYSVTVDPDLAGLAARTVAAMGGAAMRGVVVTAILHRDQKNREALLRGWPQGHSAPGMFTWPERPGDELAALHAKVLVADARDALVTSANLTYHGYEGNVEVGVRVTGQAARELELVFHELIRVKDFVLWEDDAA